ncbi:5-hydroxytryptamine receptor 3A-like [Solea senegalensis]|uniref:5-hydroxytryptamine receptor 3A-like n=1 Tax=Solea senegalensis TaxID=28829 RepID=A0AAV6RJI8_SOLSE|nr:5-hydroxytryptamine receptor 3A-like isoform X1 [Solea senegalensis]KAG7505661.1 5-hydroxytryptamine receptor 3A-like [Solea senegalensis]
MHTLDCGRTMLGLTVVASLAFIATAAGVSSSQSTDCSYLSLLNHLTLTSSDEALSLTRPVKNWTTPTAVMLDLVLLGILQLDEKSQTVTSHAWIQTSWNNEYMRWNSSDFCGINMLTIPKSKFWVPDIFIQEDVSDSGSVEQSPLVSLYSTGWVLAKARHRLTFTCQLDLFLFPFDVQTCNITFSSMHHTGDVLQLGSLNNAAVLSTLSETLMVTEGEWELDNLTIIHIPYTSIVTDGNRLLYVVRLTRKPMLYVINLIVPLLYFLILDLASFFIRGEKLNFKVTVLLSISVLLLILQDMLPSTDRRMLLMANLCVVVFSLVGMSILETMLVEFLMALDDCYPQKDQSSVSTNVKALQEVASHTEPAGAEEKGQVDPVMSPKDQDLLKLILEEVKAAHQKMERPGKEERKPGRYTRLAIVINSVYFSLYFIAVVIYLVCMYLAWVDGIEFAGF